MAKQIEETVRELQETVIALQQQLLQFVSGTQGAGTRPEVLQARPEPYVYADPVTVQFVRHWDRYNPHEIATFERTVAEPLITRDARGAVTARALAPLGPSPLGPRGRTVGGQIAASVTSAQALAGLIDADTIDDGSGSFTPTGG